MFRVVIGGLRTVLALAIAVVSLSLSLRLGIDRYRVNLVKLKVETRTVAAIEGNTAEHWVRIALDNIRLAEDAVHKFPADVDLYLELAANQRMIGDLRGAERTYRAGLKVARRPELLVNLGEVLLARDDPAGAAAAFAEVYRHNPVWLDDSQRRLAESLNPTRGIGG